MLESLIQFDKDVLISLNSMGSETFDPLMRLFSAIGFWIPVYLFLIFFMIRSNKKQGLLAVFLLFLTLLLTEQISVHAFKEVFERLRPCHDDAIKEQIRLVATSCGGQFGFVSTHATNAAGLLVFSSLFFKKKFVFWILLVWVVVVSYSRIYVGVHYPGDIIGGWLLGTTIGIICYQIFRLLLKHRIFYESTR